MSHAHRAKRATARQEKEDEMFDNRSTATILAELLPELERLGVVKVEGQYQGGNDEGGLDEIRLLNVEGVAVEPPGFEWNHPIWQGCDELLSTKFGTWAGDWSAYGTLHVDVKEKRAWTEGEMQTYDTDTEPLDARL